MDAALSNAVSESVSSDGIDPTHHPIRLSLEEMQEVLRHWESMDAVKWDDNTRMECSTLIEEESLSVDQWKALLVKVPDQVEERYRKVMQMLLDKRLIDQWAFDAEMETMPQFSPGTLARRGKEFADWYRNTD